MMFGFNLLHENKEMEHRRLSGESGRRSSKHAAARPKSPWQGAPPVPAGSGNGIKANDQAPLISAACPFVHSGALALPVPQAFDAAQLFPFGGQFC